MSDSKNGFMPVKKVVISLSENKLDDLNIFVNGLLGICPGVKIYADGETYVEIKNIFNQRPGVVKGGELHHLHFEPAGYDIDLAIIGPRALATYSESILFNPEDVDDKRINLVMTMAANWHRTLILVNPQIEVYQDLIAKLQNNNGMISAVARIIYSHEAMSWLHDRTGKMLYILGGAIK